MRITNNMLINNMLANLNTNLDRMSRYQTQLATGKKITLPSDDPIVASRSLKLRTDVAEIKQYQRNVEDAMSWMEITETTLAQMGDVMHRLRELTVQGANGTTTTEDLEKLKKEVEQLKIQMTHLANTTYAGRYIFSGFKTDKPLMDENGIFQIDIANSEQIFFEIGMGDDIHVNVTGSDLFNNEIDASANDKSGIIQTFDDIIAALEAGDHESVGDSLSQIDADINNILRVRSGVGARMNRLELTANRLEDDFINFTKLMSKNEDVDMAEAIMNLLNEENVYKASLSAGARVIQPSLVEFLK
ncbi:MAG: flagellar hook-associated protein FlgL [Clostridiaceae bacterium]|jgi:flagellar hook-associated protein 3 FlgL|nr:flagellar hook-associated protein FlgL [Clostridiaceae bacterium]